MGELIYLFGRHSMPPTGDKDIRCLGHQWPCTICWKIIPRGEMVEIWTDSLAHLTCADERRGRVRSRPL
jgi:hypothetical protein